MMTSLFRNVPVVYICLTLVIPLGNVLNSVHTAKKETTMACSIILVYALCNNTITQSEEDMPIT